MPSRKDKVTAQAAHLLDVYRALRARFAILEPLLFDQDLLKRVGAGRRAQGLNIMRGALVESCILEIAKIIHDGGARSPSMKGLTSALEDDELRTDLREDYAVWNIVPSDIGDPHVLALIQSSEQRDEAQRRTRFDDLVAELRSRAKQFDSSAATASVRQIRDQLIAHNQLSFDGSSYKPLDVTTLGLKLGDIGSMIDALEPTMDAITLIFRNSSFDFTRLRDQLTDDRNAFWASSP